LGVFLGDSENCFFLLGDDLSFCRLRLLLADSAETSHQNMYAYPKRVRERSKKGASNLMHDFKQCYNQK